MNVYETIISIIDEKGPITFHQISEHINDTLSPSIHIQPSHVETIINNEKELFRVKEDKVKINPDKVPISLKINISGYPGPCLRLNIDFKKNQFTLFEWYYHSNSDFPNKNTFTPGNVDDFKLELYKLKPWGWEEDYQVEGIILDGICWSIRLETKKGIYEKEGLEAFPDNWKQFCHAISNLTGKPIAEMLPK